MVIRYFQSLAKNDTLTLKQLSQKLVLLMALVEASKVSELQVLNLRYQSYHLEGILFQLPTLGKKRTVGAPPKQLMFGAFPSDSRLCVMKRLRQYETETLIHRKNDMSSSQPLFISCQTSQTSNPSMPG